MVDTATCLHCDQEFEVTPDMYGYRTPCPLCGKKLDLFPDDQFFVDTPWGKIGISVPDYKFWIKPMFTAMLKGIGKG